jgi:cobalamin biosynthesis protein CobD/CbiB
MSLFSLIVALVLEQWRPLADRQALLAPLARYAVFLESQFNAGEERHGMVAWLLAVLPAVLVSWLIYWLALHAGTLGPIAALAVNVAALYVTMGFRQFSHAFTAIQIALKEDDLIRARQILGGWLGRDCSDLSQEEVVRLAIEEALTASHRHVFGVAFWFVVLPGPAGAVLYRIGMFLARRWGAADPVRAPELAVFGKFARDAFAILDWLPVRITATAFAVVGDFEDAVYCWRSQAAKWSDPALGIVLAAGAGAMGVRLGMPLAWSDGTVTERPELGVGDDADPGFLDSTVGLVWRALMLYLIMLLLLGVARAVS